MENQEHEMTQAQRCERCICADPENCTQEIPGRLCKRIYGTGRTQEPSVDVRQWDVWNETLQKTPHTGTRINRDDSYWTVVVLASDHDAALSSLRTELVAARAEIERLTLLWNTEHELHKQNVYGYQAEIATLRAENEKLAAAEKDAQRFVYLVSQGMPEICMALDGAPCYSLPAARKAIDDGMAPDFDAALGRGK